MKYFLLGLLLIATPYSYAADGGSVSVETPAASHKAVLIKSGKETYLDFQDGRVAGFFQEIGKVIRLKLPLRQIENTCDFQQILSNCYLELDLAPRHVSVEWVRHSEPSKIGQIITRKKTQNDVVSQDEVVDNTNAFAWFTVQKEPKYAALFKTDRLVCDSFAWAKNIPLISSRMNIESWTTELMLENRETKANENQSDGGVFNMVLKKIDDHTFELEKFGRTKSIVPALPPHISPQVTSLNFIDKNKQQCQVSFETSFEELTKTISSPEFNKTDRATRSAVQDPRALMSSDLYYAVIFAISNESSGDFQ
jgi:hypothetical protein